MTTDDPNVIEPGHLPTPFTADEIRDATQRGLAIDTIAEQVGEIVSRRRTTFVDVDAEGCIIESVEIDESASPIGEPQTGSSSWVELQHHASFHADRAERTSAIVELPIGTLDCWRYDVEVADGMTSSFWFSKQHPGQPVRYAVHLDDGLERITTVTAIHRPE